MFEPPRIAARACIIRDGAILLTKYSDHRGFCYVMPGGGQHSGETLHECLVREVREELNVIPSIGRLLYIREIIASRHHAPNLPMSFHQVEVFFECSLPEENAPDMGRTPDPNQVGHEWVPLAELPNIRFFPSGIAQDIMHPDLIGRYIGEMG